jgi:hypothetical protein
MEPAQIALLKMARLGIRTQYAAQMAKLDELVGEGYLQCEEGGPATALRPASPSTYRLTSAGEALLAKVNG